MFGDKSGGKAPWTMTSIEKLDRLERGWDNLETRLYRLENPPQETRLFERLSNIETLLELLMRRDGLQRVRVTEEIYQDLRTVISETREELRKVKPAPK